MPDDLFEAVNALDGTDPSQATPAPSVLELLTAQTTPPQPPPTEGSVSSGIRELFTHPISSSMAFRDALPTAVRLEYELAAQPRKRRPPMSLRKQAVAGVKGAASFAWQLSELWAPIELMFFLTPGMMPKGSIVES